MPLTSKVTAILLHFGYVASDFRKNQIQGFRTEILLIDRSNGHYNQLEISAKTNVSFS
jgi:hypothetical protein